MTDYQGPNAGHLQEIWQRGYRAGFAGQALDPPKSPSQIEAYRTGWYAGKDVRNNLIAKGIDPKPPQTTAHRLIRSGDRLIEVKRGGSQIP